MTSDSPTIVLYHANCNDGFCAAWAIHRYVPGSDAFEFVPVQYGQAPPEVRGKRVLIVDFSYKRDVMIDIFARAQHVTVLDHHKTAEAELADIDDDPLCQLGARRPLIVFDMLKSGGRLTWEWILRIVPSLPIMETAWLVNYTEDRDMWWWRLPQSREVNAGIESYPREFKVWDELYLGGADAIAKEGAAILRYQNKVRDDHVKNAVDVEIDGHKVLAVNATTMFSEVAGTLAIGRPFGVAWFVRGDGMVVHSLRSADDGIDVSELAKRHGGGGHKHAAGFESFDCAWKECESEAA